MVGMVRQPVRGKALTLANVKQLDAASGTMARWTSDNDKVFFFETFLICSAGQLLETGRAAADLEVKLIHLPLPHIMPHKFK